METVVSYQFLIYSAFGIDLCLFTSHMLNYCDRCVLKGKEIRATKMLDGLSLCSGVINSLELMDINLSHG